MTNFELWIKDLTAEKMIQYFEDGFFDGCTDCPAIKFCRKYITEDGNCSDMFVEWGNIPIEGNGKV